MWSAWRGKTLLSTRRFQIVLAWRMALPWYRRLDWFSYRWACGIGPLELRRWNLDAG